MIRTDRIQIDKDFIEKKHGLLNALSFASADYITLVLKKHGKLKNFPSKKLGELQRTVVHKNPHLDEYFAELFFRSILPFHMKDLEVVEHILLSTENDSLAQVTWPNGVIFGYSKDKRGGVTALEFFDEHVSDGSRKELSCSQIVANRYLYKSLPSSIRWVLDEVNQIDSSGGAHSYNLANLIKKMHDIAYVVGYDKIQNSFIKKYLTENWKRAIISACICAMIYTYENELLSLELNSDEEDKLNYFSLKSLNYFLNRTILKQYYKDFPKAIGMIKSNFKPGNKTLEKTRKWETSKGQVEQNLIMHKLSFALDRCWGRDIANFVMMHLWQTEFQFQMSFIKLQQEIRELGFPEVETKTSFGSIQIMEIANSNLIPVQKEKDLIKKNFKPNQPLRILYASVNDPEYSNVTTVLKKIVNTNYQGFGLMIVKDKTLNGTVVNAGSTVPSRFWEYISNSIQKEEPERWFQLVNDGHYAEFILNRTKSHQEHLPTEKITLDFLYRFTSRYLT